MAIGNLHRLHPVAKPLDLARHERIRAEVPCSLSLHGGSGTPEDQFRGAMARGVSKININSELRPAYRSTLERQPAAHPDEFAIVRLIGPVIDAVRLVVERKMEVFGSAGRALRA